MLRGVKTMIVTSKSSQTDWAGNTRSFVVAWGSSYRRHGAGDIPRPPIPKTIVWIVALGWMGTACLLNAKRCGRVHCQFTGPFFLIMIVPVFLHGFAIIPFGAEGWKWLGIAIGVGGGGLWCLTEHIWGRYREARTRL